MFRGRLGETDADVGIFGGAGSFPKRIRGAAGVCCRPGGIVAHVTFDLLQLLPVPLNFFVGPAASLAIVERNADR